MGNNQAETPDSSVIRIIIDVQRKDGESVHFGESVNPRMLEAISEYAVFSVLNEDSVTFQEKGVSAHNHIEYDGAGNCLFCVYHKDEVHNNREA